MHTLAIVKFNEKCISITLVYSQREQYRMHDLSVRCNFQRHCSWTSFSEFVTHMDV